MNHEEMTKVVALLTEADGGCPHCVRNLLKGFRSAFPAFSVAEVLTAAKGAGYDTAYFEIGPEDFEGAP